MIKYLCSFFVRDCENYSDADTVKCYGILCSLMGIALNLVLFFIKLFVGKRSGSAAVTVDAVHNLTDMGSSVVTLISFLLYGKNKAVRENLAGLFIGFVLFVTGVELAVMSVEKIYSPDKIEFSFLTVMLLLVSVAVKIFMAAVNRKYSRKTRSVALEAAAADCFCDSLATMVAAAAVTASALTDANIDAWGGLAVSLFILFAGGKTTICSLLQLFSYKKQNS